MNLLNNNRFSQSNNNFKLISIFSILFLVFFSRFFVNLGAPSILNHTHYIVTLLFFLLYFPNITKNFDNFAILVTLLFFSLLISSLVNSTSIYNVVVYFLIIFQPFLIILLILELKIDKQNINKIKNLLLLIALINTCLVYYQFFIENLRKDDVTGLFFGLGTGPHSSALFNSLIALKVIFEDRYNLNFKKYVLSLILLSVIFLSSANQIILIFTTGLILYYFFRFFSKPNKKNFFKIFLFIFVIIIFFQFIKTIEDYENITSIRYISDIKEALIIKYSVFLYLIENFNNFNNYFFGFGPGHGISRLAYEMEKFSEINFSNTDISSKIYFIQESNWLNNHITGSSIFTLNFFLSGLFSELGLCGVVIYLSIWMKFFNKLKNNDICLIYILITLIFMAVYRWQEEPIFIVFISTYIGMNLKELSIER